MGNKNFHRERIRESRIVDMVTKVHMIGEAVSRGTSPNVVREMLRSPSVAPFEKFDIPDEINRYVTGDLLGKFTFASDRFAVLVTAGHLELDVLFHRHLPNISFLSSSRESNESIRPVILKTKPFSDTDVDNKAAGHLDQGTSRVTGEVRVAFETREGSGKSGKDYIYSQGTLVFAESEVSKTIKVPIVQGKEPGSEVDFYVILKNPTGGGALGDPSIARVSVMDDNDPGEFLLDEPHYYANMKTGIAIVHIVREHGFDGNVTIEYSTIDGTATGGKELKPGVHYLESHGRLHFNSGDTDKTLSFITNKSAEGSKNFIVTIRNPSGGAKVGLRSAAVVHLTKDELMERVDELLDNDEDTQITWSAQFIQAMSVIPEKDEDGNDVNPKWTNYMMHFLTFFWKMFCAFIPPTSYYGAWPSFFFSLAFIGIMTTVVEQLGNLLGCVVGLETSVAGITIIALGTSLPDTFASRTAALQDEHADAAIGNVTGSNSVNVFLGLGLPWVLKTMHALIYGYTFKVKTDNLTQSVLIFGIAGTICIITLLIRRKVLGGELGGKQLSVKVVSSGFLFLLWMIYIMVSSLKAYGKIDF